MVLICLAVSMTAGSVLLSWLQPGPVSVRLRPRAAPHAMAAIAAVSSRDVPPLSWGGVTIVLLGEPEPLATLAAIKPQHQVHFIVSDTGSVAVRQPWREQVRLDDSDQIRIALDSSGGLEPPQSSQFAGLRCLIDALNAAVPTLCEIAPLPITLELGGGNQPVTRTLDALLNALASET